MSTQIAPINHPMECGCDPTEWGAMCDKCSELSCQEHAVWGEHDGMVVGPCCADLAPRPSDAMTHFRPVTNHQGEHVMLITKGEHVGQHEIVRRYKNGKYVLRINGRTCKLAPWWLHCGPDIADHYVGKFE